MRKNIENSAFLRKEGLGGSEVLEEKFEKRLERLRAKKFRGSLERIREDIMHLYEGDPEADFDEKSFEIYQVLEHADAHSVLSTVREAIDKEIQAGLFESANRLAETLHLNAEVKKVNSAWLDDLYRRYTEASDSQKKELIQQVGDQQYRKGVDSDPRFQELIFIKSLDELRSFYKDKKKKKTGQSFQEAVQLFEGYPGFLQHVQSAAPELYEKIHKDAVQEVRDRRDSKITEKFIDMGLLDFDNDFELIEEVTRPS